MPTKKKAEDFKYGGVALPHAPIIWDDCQDDQQRTAFAIGELSRKDHARVLTYLDNNEVRR